MTYLAPPCCGAGLCAEGPASLQGTLTAALQGAIAAIAALTAWLALQPAAKHALQRQQKQQ